MPIVTTVDHALVVGLSSNVLEASGAFARPDGIGVYTRELGTALASLGVSVLPLGSTMRAVPQPVSRFP